MTCTSIGGVRVKGLLQLPRFFKLAFAAKKAALESDGCLGVDMFRRGRLFFVQSVWDGPAQMKAYAHASVHGRLMANDATLFDFFYNMTVPDVDALSRDDAVAAWHERFDV